MAYRDDRDADQARIASLEAELAQAQKKIADLEHEESTALVRAGGNALAVASGTGKPPGTERRSASTSRASSRASFRAINSRI